MSEAKLINDTFEQISNLINIGEYSIALKLLYEFESKYPKDVQIFFNKVGFLIDIGQGLRDINLVKSGIELGEKILTTNTSEAYNTNLYYNLANGYSALYSLDYNTEEPFKYLLGNEYLQRSKNYLRNALKNSDKLDQNFKLQLWTNYGNCLDTLGRGIEAIYAYEEALKIDSKFSMALGNKAKALRIFAEISGIYRDAIYIYSHQMLKSILDNADLIAYGGIRARDHFISEIKFIESRVKKENLSEKISHPELKYNRYTKFEKYYIKFCLAHQLFLNFHIHENYCKASISDPIFISLITEAKDHNSFYDLAKQINQIKEDYAVARLLLVQSQFKKDEITRISKLTALVNTMDYSDFNIYIGLLKSAFKIAYNIFDKISRFLNEYLNLGITGNIYFTTIWQRKVSKNIYEIKPEIINRKNLSLCALFDIFLDMKSGFYRKIQDIRNAAVHEKLVIYDSVLTDWDSKEDRNNIGSEMMLTQTINLFNLVKSAIIYLINFVNLEENKKVYNKDVIFIPKYLDLTQYI